MRDIREADLTEAVRSEALYLDAVKHGLIENSEAGELRFFGLIEHARCYGTKNRPGLLRALVERKRWHYVTQDDEEAARRRLKRLKLPVPPAPVRSTSSASTERVPLAVSQLLDSMLAAFAPALGTRANDCGNARRTHTREAVR